MAEAWHVVKTVDPLIDSDDEEMDYNKRIDISEFSIGLFFLTLLIFLSSKPAV